MKTTLSYIFCLMVTIHRIISNFIGPGFMRRTLKIYTWCKYIKSKLENLRVGPRTFYKCLRAKQRCSSQTFSGLREVQKENSE